jgi:hypothetical protein
MSAHSAAAARISARGLPPRGLSRINPIQADYSFAQALWIALALFRDLDDGFGNQSLLTGLLFLLSFSE